MKRIGSAAAFAAALMCIIAAEPASAKPGEGSSAYMGVYLEELSPAVREALDIKADGALIEDVVADGPAAKAGLAAGDILTEVGGVRITKAGDVSQAVAKFKPNDKVKVVAIRKGKSKKFELSLGERPAAPMAIHKEIEVVTKRPFLGVSTEMIEGQLAEYFGVKSGALVEEVVKDSPAEKAGIKAGDVILAFDDEEIEDEDDLMEAILEKEPGQEAKVKLSRRGSPMELTVTLAEREAPHAMFWGDDDDEEKRIVIKRGGAHQGGAEIDWDDIHRALKNAMKEIQVKIETENYREDIEKLKKEIESLKVEIESQLKELKSKSDKNAPADKTKS